MRVKCQGKEKGEVLVPKVLFSLIEPYAEAGNRPIRRNTLTYITRAVREVRARGG